MAIGNSSGKQHCKAGRRNRAVGAAGTVAAFLALGMTPLATAPSAHADELDWVVDLLTFFDPSVFGPAADVGAGTEGVSGALAAASSLPADAVPSATTGVDSVFGNSPFF